ncbi:MAG: flagellar basal body rod protein FlgC [Clostridiales bacterium]|nr:flagellar basal body rod protein FlgC [Clostridiales bacterium]
MSFLSSLNIAGSALTAQRLRMDIISQNIANADTTRTEEGGPYTRKVVVMEERADFGDMMKSKAAGKGVEVTAIKEDPSEYKLVYEPGHADADENGYVKYPNVDMVKEIMDMMSASRAYEANVTAVNAVKTMAASALKIGR